MITVQEAEKLILDSIGEIETETVSIEEALGRCLREPIVADRALPPFDRATLDGIAINSSSYNTGQRKFNIAGTAAAGTPQAELPDVKSAFEIMTGAPLPRLADCVIPVEEIKITGNTVKLPDGLQLDFHSGVHSQGSDCKSGKELLSAHRLITAKEIAIAASVGKTEIVTSKMPRIAIVSTGDELVSIEQIPESHQIRRSNDITLSAALKSSGFTDVELAHIPDDPEELETQLRAILERCDSLILAGGVSKGKYDHIPETLAKLGVSIRFQWVSQRPGKPMWYGQFSRGGERRPVFALPGNPVSCFTCLRRYAIPAFEKWVGLPKTNPVYAKLAHDLTFKPELTLFLPAIADPRPSGELWVKPALFNTSGDFVSVAQTDGFIELPKARNIFPEGEAFQYYPWPR
ncbi:molybdopterin molybdotransferase MoeA [Pelagicoccus sp. SDUM812002]|uniref:molybdopterin molybdotransferase MoeA n=1 Tax=Pelagicoccus sp. SDUM812002 TaxID=3041266 RepID=UPI00280F1C75|nr:molybdopterin molybdotransferase MoeA [Pelagicoccus sp. SDUM812002]MDQ8186374.1 molybdopterin molybdotransferase MoeA [Pelagicoccus sp. SDUM812002]